MLRSAPISSEKTQCHLKRVKMERAHQNAHKVAREDAYAGEIGVRGAVTSENEGRSLGIETQLVPKVLLHVEPQLTSI